MGRDNNSGTTLTITDFLSLILSKFVELRVLTSDKMFAIRMANHSSLSHIFVTSIRY